jgi:hypothetical protein
VTELKVSKMEREESESLKTVKKNINVNSIMEIQARTSIVGKRESNDEERLR